MAGLGGIVSVVSRDVSPVLPARRARAWGAVVLAVVLVLLFVGSCMFVQGGGEVAAPVSGPGEPVAVIGDSLTEHMVPYLVEELEGSGYKPVLLFGRSGYSMYDLLGADLGLDLLPELPGTVVLALGTVDMRRVPPESMEASIEELLVRLGPDRRVIWLNAYRDDDAPMLEEVPVVEEGVLARGGHSAFNALLEEAALRHPNLVVVDWNAFVVEGGASVLDDGIHYDVPGYRARASFLRDALGPGSPAVGQGCVRAAEESAMTVLGEAGVPPRRAFGQVVPFEGEGSAAVGLAFGSGPDWYAAVTVRCGVDGAAPSGVSGVGELGVTLDLVTEQARVSCGGPSGEGDVVLTRAGWYLVTAAGECALGVAEDGSVISEGWVSTGPGESGSSGALPGSSGVGGAVEALRCARAAEVGGPSLVTVVGNVRPGASGSPERFVALWQVDDVLGGRHCVMDGAGAARGDLRVI